MGETGRGRSVDRSAERAGGWRQQGWRRRGRGEGQAGRGRQVGVRSFSKDGNAVCVRRGGRRNIGDVRRGLPVYW